MSSTDEKEGGSYLEVIMIHSYKGGSGKTIISYNLARVFAEHGKKVLLIEGDLDGPVFANNFRTLNPSKFINFYLKEPKNLETYIVRNNPFDMIFASSEFAHQNLMRNRDYESLLQNILDVKKEIHTLDYDIVIIDLSPGVNYLAIASVVLADHIVLALRPDQNSFEGFKILLDRVYANTIPSGEKNFHVIINQVPDLSGFDEIINEWKIIIKYEYPFLQSIHKIPFSPPSSLKILQNEVLLDDDDPISEKLEEIAKSINA
ncbi:MAG: MinD/ParA family ATP-binding protein [Candidatus Kariarchaeaceae archaeon]